MSGMKADGDTITFYGGPVTQEHLKRIVLLKMKIEKFKKYYVELDELTVELAKTRKTFHQLGPTTIAVVDNFEKKNTVFRACAVRRFEVMLLNTDQIKKKKK